MLQKISATETKLIDKILDIYIDSFPKDERRPVNEWLNILHNNNQFTLYGVIIEHEIAGFITSWDLTPEIVYIEHFAISKNMRGKNIGSRIITQFIKETKSKSIILEVEIPELATEKEEKNIRESRIKFYERLGFILQSFNYEQPSYHGDNKTISLKLMEYGEGILSDNYIPIRNKMYNEIYNFNPDKL